MSHLQLTKRKISNETSCGTHKHKRSGGLPQIYCDMDMVICDFIGGYEQLTGKDFAKTDKDERGKKSRQRKISGQHLNGCLTSQRMWKLINKYNANILSAYSNRDANSRAQ